MMMNSRNFIWRCVPLCLTMLALVIFLVDGSVAVAAEDAGSHSGGQGSSHVSKGKQGGSGHDSGHASGHGSSDVKGKGNHGGGKSGNDAITRDRGQRPVWAREGLPEVELGRLNAARAPDHVLSRALAEAHTAIANDPQAGVHSPPQNLALYWEAMTSQGKWTREQAAAFLGAAADKRVPITTDTVKALNIILGVSESDPASMAEAADSVRQQLLADHDENESGGH